jgi:hypothetical protein
MGYIGLLLNAPYKIDSMVWMMLMMMCRFCIDYLSFLFWVWLSKLGHKMGVRTLEWE